MDIPEDCFKKIVKKWPPPRVVRPSVTSLVKAHTPQLPALQPLDPQLIAEYEESQVKLQTATETLDAVEKEYGKVCKELETLEKGNQWNNRGNREIRMHQLVKDIATIKKKKESAKEVYDSILKNGENLNYIITTHKSLEESYEKLNKMRIC